LTFFITPFHYTDCFSVRQIGYGGNLNTDTLAQIDARRKEIGFIEQSCAVDEKCKICKWYQLCRGGCRRDRDYYQDGIGRNYYCAAYERFFEYAWPKLGEVYEEVIRG